MASEAVTRISETLFAQLAEQAAAKLRSLAIGSFESVLIQLLMVNRYMSTVDGQPI